MSDESASVHRHHRTAPGNLVVGVLTVSDTRTEEDDRSGRTLVDRAQAAGHRVVDKQIIPDEVALIEAQLRAWIADPDVDVHASTP